MRRHLFACADLILLGLLAYVPALGSAPGRMPADTKLSLYTDPGGLLADARWSYDPRLFGGWVTHQIVSYLWPSGPWFWTFDTLGLPDWVAHRLWIATLLFAAGVGARWLARQLGLAPVPALIAALAYQCSPYLLPYVSRTSVMLLTWAGLPWLIGLTRRAVHRGGWRDPALFALVLVTVGGVNVAATLMIAAGPVLWLLHEAWDGEVARRQVAAAAARVSLLAAGACAWWVGAVSVQGTYGADVLTLSESFRDVASTASAGEALRGQGYWLSYVQEPVPTTSMARVYQDSFLLAGLGFLLVALALAGLLLVRWRPGRFAAWSIFVGVLLASAAHLTSSPSVLARFLDDHAANSLVLGLRSSTRSVPLVAIGVGLGLGALTQWAMPRLRASRAVPLVAGVLVLANLPALWSFDLVDPLNDRDDPVPAAWSDTAALLAEAPSGFRTLQLPGAEFGAHTWGVTVDPVLSGLSRRGLLTRDLLPLGAPGVMDMFFALDDRIQQGAFEPASLAAVARLLGADRIVVPLDLDTARYGTYSPEAFASSLSDASGVGSVDGTPAADIFEVTEPRPITGAGGSEVLFAGDGAGVVDAAAAGLITGHETLVAAAGLSADALRVAAGTATTIVLTDQNRQRAHHWRTSQDVLGMTEDAGSVPTAEGDYRLPAFPAETDAARTFAHQEGQVVATASGYGAPLAYRPEDRPAQSVDGDPDTGWLVARGVDPTGQWLRLDFAEPVDLGSLRLVQRADQSRWITAVTLTSDAGTEAISLTGRDEQIATSLGTATWLQIRIDRFDAASSFGDAANGVGFSEVSAGGVTGTEVVQLPTLLGDVDIDPATPFAIVMSRERADRPERDRRDPEARLVRQFTLAQPRAFDVLATGERCDADVLTVDGSPVLLTAAGGSCRGAAPLDLSAGVHRLQTSPGATLDRVVLSSGTWPVATEAAVPVEVTQDDRTHRRIEVGPCPEGCWAVLGEGLNSGWSAHLDGTALGQATFVNGGMNGWRLPPSTTARELSLDWTPQRRTDVALTLTALTSIAALVLLVVARRRPMPDAAAAPVPYREGHLPVPWLLIAAAGTVALVAISPIYAAILVAGLFVARGHALRSRLGGAAVAAVVFIGGGYAAAVLLFSPTPGFGWVSQFDWAHRPALMATLMVAVALALRGDEADRSELSSGRSPDTRNRP